MPPATGNDALLCLLDAAADGILFTGADGRVAACNLAFRRAAATLGLGLDGTFADRLAGLADRTTEPYAFTAAAARLRDGAGGVAFEEAAGETAFRLEASAPSAAGRVWVLRDVTAARDAARAHDERVGALAHELRTPLTAMTGFIELLEDGSAGPLTSEQARYLEIVRRAAERLRGLVDELLDEGSGAS